MDEILSEKDLLPSGTSWGEWEFSLTNEQISEKLTFFPRISDDSAEDPGPWKSLFSLLPTKQGVQECASKEISAICIDEDSAMELSPARPEEIECDFNNSLVEDLTVRLVDSCNQFAPRLKSGFNTVLEEMDSLIKDLQNLNEGFFIQVLEKAWSQLHLGESKMCFCLAFSSESNLCQKLCKCILFPSMSKSLPGKLDQFSEIFLLNGEIFCRQLIALLLQVQDSPLVKDLYSLEEIMTSMAKRHWTVLLAELLAGLKALQSWNVPVFAMTVEHSEPTFEDIRVLVQLMSSTGINVAQSRDFGSLLVAVVNSLKPGFGLVIPQLKVIANNCKGPLKFKALKILGQMKEV